MEHADIRSQLNSGLWEHLPESKLELISGKLIAGNSLAGSRYLLWAILQSCGSRAALPFAPAAMWRQALCEVFSAPPSLAWPGGWQRWAAQSEPLHFWSELTLVASGLPSHSYDVHTALRGLGSEPEIELRRIEELSQRQAAALLDEGRELERLP